MKQNQLTKDILGCLSSNGRLRGIQIFDLCGLDSQFEFFTTLRSLERDKSILAMSDGEGEVPPRVYEITPRGQEKLESLLV